MHTTLYLSALSIALMAAPQAYAQIVPDAGRILQEMPVPQPKLPDSVDVDVDVPQTGGEVKAGGPKVLLKGIHFSGNSRIESAALQALVAPSLNQELDLKGLQDVTLTVTRYYRENGYPFARAYLPAQRMGKGDLNIEIIEGRYGKVAATSSQGSVLPAKAQPFLSSLKSGEVIESAPLERAVLILSDLPGVAVRPIIRPGQEVGAGDLEVQTSLAKKWQGMVSLDNYGNRYSGRNRLTAQGAWNSAFLFGDQLSAAVMATDEKLYFGSVSYSLPLGTSGLRGDVGFAKSSYELGKDFAVLGAEGNAQITTVGVSYPILRSNKANVLITGHYQYKDLEDKYTALNIRNLKSSHSVPIGLQFDVRDNLLGGGLTYGGLVYTVGDLALDTPGLREQDRATARSAGSFSKLNFDLARLQALPADFTLFGRAVGQWTKDNLDSSERFSLGGPNGVRAYPQGEGIGDQGILAQIELRYQIGFFTPYLFLDAGKVKINRNPWSAGDNYRSLSGEGVGVRFQKGNLLLDGVAAWRRHGGDALTDTRQSQPQFWLKAAYQF